MFQLFKFVAQYDGVNDGWVLQEESEDKEDLEGKAQALRDSGEQASVEEKNNTGSTIVFSRAE